MPVSVVCESAANVNAALRESLGSGVGMSCHHDSSASISSGAASAGTTQTLQDKLVASAKRVLLTKIEYEEVNNYSQSILDTLKSKYIVLKPTPSNSINTNGSGGNKVPHNGSIDNESNQNQNTSISTTYTAGTPSEKKNPNELPQPKRVLFQRENIRVGWKNPSRKWQVGVGMMNVGNTCYLNSTLQALFHVPSLATWLLSDGTHMEKCETENSNCIICAVAKTLQASQSNQSAIRPYFVYSKLKSICRHMNMGWQEDAHEFLRYLVESMEKSYLSRFRNFKELDQYSKETTPLNQILGGYLKSAVRCLACGHVSTTFQHFQDLLLDIRKVDTIEEALDAYFARERLEDMGYKCESCKKKVSATKQFSLERAPIALCIQLKRFSVLGTKLNKQITIRPRLDMSKFSSRKSTSDQLTYKLVAMITHLGASQHCGHYTAIGLTESGTYYSFDDSYVRPISVQSVCNTNAYIIFYEIDATPARQPSSTVTNAQACVNNKQDQSNENYNRQNYVASSTTTVGLATSTVPSKTPCKQQSETPQMIGPQLPSNSPYTNGPSSSTTIKGANSALATIPPQNSKLLTNRQSCIPTSSSKIMIHFKSSNPTTPTTNANATCKTAAATNSTTTSATSTTNGSKGTCKFQDSTITRNQMVNNANKGKEPAISNGKIHSNESSHNDDSYDNKVTSTQNDVGSSSTLPSMPTLGGQSTNSLSKFNRSPKSVGSSETLTTSLVTTTTSNGCSSKSHLKSLVPYESESDEDDNNEASPLNVDNDTTKKKIVTATLSTANRPIVNPATSSKSQLQSKTKHKSDPIDSIFNAKPNRNNSISSSCNKNNNNNNNSKTQPSGGTPPKKLKLLHEPNDDNNVNDETIDVNESKWVSSTNTEFKRAKSTPPSPPVIKTKTGLWQVTPLQQSDSSPERKIKNPFATQKSTHRSSKTITDKRFPINGYQKSNNGDASDKTNNIVGELLKQSHRGYGAPVLSWNGSKSEMEKEITEEIRLQRKRDWEDEDKTEMDRGHQKKIKSQKSQNNGNGPVGYNPFQEQQRQLNNVYRWKGANGGGGGGHRFKNSNFRVGNNFHHHRSGHYTASFKRFNQKYHHKHHQRNGGNHDFHRRSS